MKTILFYFTGTGNSLDVAFQLQKALPEAELMPIAGLLLKGEKITLPNGVKAGVIMPMYCGGLPNIVVRFFEQADFSRASYVFTVITEGGKTQANPLKTISSLMKKAGHELNGSWWVQMPDNYIPLDSAIPQDIQKQIFNETKQKIKDISKSIINEEQVLEKEKFIGFLIRVLGYKLFMKKIYEFDKKFTISDTCVHCMTCVRICPVNNIEYNEQTGFTHLHKCECCLACLQFCPKQAISCGKKTESRERYHNPNIKVSDIIKQKRMEE